MDNPETQLNTEQVRAVILQLQKNAQAIAGLKKAKRATAPYYKVDFVPQIKEILDTVATKGRSVDVNFGLEASSNRSRWYQALAYLLDNEDPDGIYKQIREVIEVRATSTGVRVSPRKIAAGLSVLPTSNEWREQLERFVVAAPSGKVLKYQGLPWTSEDLTWARKLIEDSPNRGRFVYIISKTEISVYCTEEEPMQVADINADDVI